MKTFTIEIETNNITIHGSAKEAEAAADSERFGNEATLAKLAAKWPAARLVEIWNSLPGATPVKKFKDRATATSRIWRAIQDLGPNEAATGTAPVADPLAGVGETTRTESSVAESTQTSSSTPVAPQTPDVASKVPPVKNKATSAKCAPPAAKTKGTREGSKTEAILALMRQPGGASLKTIMAATNWQAHSVRGFVSGTLGKKMGLTVESTKTEDGERNYSIKG
jgi:hypothetical protein